ncbi:MAG: hypothetical protein AB8H80_00420 [Planctomycetota bacterium]
MTVERILTQHPSGKDGVNIDRAKYEAMKQSLLAVIPPEAPGVAFKDLAMLVEPHLQGTAMAPDDSVMWYVTTVKLDLEARGLVARLPGSPQRLVRG